MDAMGYIKSGKAVSAGPSTVGSSGKLDDSSISRNTSLVSEKESDRKGKMVTGSEVGEAVQRHDDGPLQNAASASGASNLQPDSVPEVPPPAYSES
jgi:hypothetical protein